MVIKNVNLETVCGITSTLPDNLLPEFAFAGKSNVGKSSLINGLMNRKNYARTSLEPGKTQLEKHLNMLRVGLGLPEEIEIYPYSALSKVGRDEIYDLMDSILAEDSTDLDG